LDGLLTGRQNLVLVGELSGMRRGQARTRSAEYALSWVAACVGLSSKIPESAASFGLIVLFPLAFVSNVMVPTQHMPGWLRAVADWNPVSAVAAGARQLCGNPNPSASIGAWPMQHPVEASLAWSVLILAVAAPLASRYLRRRTTG
jgi:ABC-2 type transport system permease protein